MRTKIPGRLATSLILFLLILIFSASKLRVNYSKLTDGILITVKEKRKNSPRLVKLQVITDKIIYVTASPNDHYTVDKSLVLDAI